MTRVTVFGAGAMGTALAIHLARKGEDVTLWGSEYDARVLPELRDRRSHPALPERLPPAIRVLGPEELADAAKEADVAVMAANSGGARSLAAMVAPALDGDPVVVSIAKGLEPDTLRRMSEVYGEELGGRPVVAIAGPALAAEVADGQPCSAVLACEDRASLASAGDALRADTYVVHTTDDCAGVEYCGTAKNVGAIAAGILEGLGQRREQAYKNARAALFTRAAHEMADLVESLGGRRETALGLAGVGDLLVTSIGGRNRQFGEMVGAGSDPRHALEDMQERGLTVEGVDSASDVHELAERATLGLPVHEAVYRVVHDGAPPTSILEAIG
ncbi:MAG: NAD(P)H-dependent glycerol-3-phosphate dehydrogenase [Actinomycetota bacterium]